MKLKTVTLIAAIGLALTIIIHFAMFPYQYMMDNPRLWVNLGTPLIRELPLAIFLIALFRKQ